MRRVLFGLLVGQIFLAGFAMADPASVIPPSSGASAVCKAPGSDLAGVNPLDGAIFLSPPQGCSSICSAANGKSCSPEGAVKSCFDVDYPDGCEACICTASLVWSCG